MTEFKLRLNGVKKGIKFNPDNKDNLTFGEALDPIANIINEEEMTQYYEDYVQWNINRLQCTRVEAEDYAKTNIGYWAGYHGVEVRSRVERFLQAEHPFLGSYKRNLTPEEILQTGIEMGKKLRGDSNSA